MQLEFCKNVKGSTDLSSPSALFVKELDAFAGKKNYFSH